MSNGSRPGSFAAAMASLKEYENKIADAQKAEKELEEHVVRAYESDSGITIEGNALGKVNNIIYPPDCDLPVKDTLDIVKELLNVFWVKTSEIKEQRVKTLLPDIKAKTTKGEVPA